jgi:hypothetical protein
MLNYGSTSLCFTSIWRDCVGWLVGTWKGDCLSNSSHLRNLMVHCLFVRSQTNSYQVLEILREDWATKRFPATLRGSSMVYLKMSLYSPWCGFRA